MFDFSRISPAASNCCRSFSQTSRSSKIAGYWKLSFFLASALGWATRPATCSSTNLMVTPQTHHDFWSAQSNRREEEEETQSRSFTTNSSAAAVGGLRVAAAASVEGFLRFSGGRLRVLRSKMHNTTSHARVRRLMQKSFFTLHFFFVSSSSLCFCVVVVLASQPPVKVSSSE